MEDGGGALSQLEQLRAVCSDVLFCCENVSTVDGDVASPTRP